MHYSSPFLHQLTVYVARVRLCPSYSRRRDCINLGLFRGYYKGGGYYLILWLLEPCLTLRCSVLKPGIIFWRMCIRPLVVVPAHGLDKSQEVQVQKAPLLGP